MAKKKQSKKIKQKSKSRGINTLTDMKNWKRETSYSYRFAKENGLLEEIKKEMGWGN